MQLDTIEEIKYKSQQRRVKMTQVKQKNDKFSKEREDKSIKEYRSNLKQLAQNGNSYSNLASTRRMQVSRSGMMSVQ